MSNAALVGASNTTMPRVDDGDLHSNGKRLAADAEDDAEGDAEGRATDRDRDPPPPSDPPEDPMSPTPSDPKSRN